MNEASEDTEEKDGENEESPRQTVYYTGDDEEYSYRGYSSDTEAQVRRRGSVATLTGDEEDYSYSGFADYDETAVTETTTYGDFIVEEFSTETNVRKVTNFTHLSENTVKYAFSIIYILVGAICVILNEYMVAAVPYIVGAFMAVIGVVQLAIAIKTKEYVHTHSNKTAGSLILIVLSVMILVEYDWANTFIAIVWGLIGLLEGAHAFNHAFSRIARGMRCSYYIVKGIIEVVLAFLLLYDPDHHISMHVIVFGVQLMFDGVTMIPALKQRLSRE